MASINTTHWRHTAKGAVLAATLGLFALLAPTVAIAAPNDGSWDVEAYDDCMKKTVRNADLCCLDSGGVPASDPNDTQSDGSPNCYAPPAQGASAEQGTPPRAPRGDLGQVPVVTATQVAPADPGGAAHGPMPTLMAPSG